MAHEDHSTVPAHRRSSSVRYRVSNERSSRLEEEVCTYKAAMSAHSQRRLSLYAMRAFSFCMVQLCQYVLPARRRYILDSDKICRLLGSTTMGSVIRTVSHAEAHGFNAAYPLAG
jgi:hypothetical protein